MLAEAFALDAGEAQRLADELLDSTVGIRRFSVHLAGPDDAAALLRLQVAADVFLRVRQHRRPAARRVRGAAAGDDAPDRGGPRHPHRRRFADPAGGAGRGAEDRRRPGGEPWSIPADDALAALGLARGDRTAVDQLLLWTAILDEPLRRGMNELTHGALIPVGGAATQPYLGSAASTPISVRMNPATDLALMRRIARAGGRRGRARGFLRRARDRPPGVPGVLSAISAVARSGGPGRHRGFRCPQIGWWTPTD